MADPTVNVRYMVDDVEAAVDFYTTHLGFRLLSSRASSLGIAAATDTAGAARADLGYEHG